MTEPTESSTIIEKGNLFNYFIKVTSITNETITIKLKLSNSLNKRKSFYIYQYRQKNSQCLAEFTINKQELDGYEDIDIKDIDGKSFKIALFEKQNDKEPLSNILPITLSNTDSDEHHHFKPNPISISTVKAIEIDDEKENNICIYFDLPHNIYGDDIAYKIKYIDGDNKNEDYNYIKTPLFIPKASIPTSFRIITSVTIDDKEYLSKPSDIITVHYQSKQKISVDTTNNELINIKTEIQQLREINDTRLDLLANTIQKNSDIMKEMQNNIDEITKQVKDLRLSVSEENKNEDIEQMKKEMERMKENINKLLNDKLLQNNKQNIKRQAMKKWMSNMVELPQYIELFMENGFDDLDIIKDITINELTMIGIDKIGHKMKIIKAVQRLHQQKHQYEGGTAYV